MPKDKKSRATGGAAGSADSKSSATAATDSKSAPAPATEVDTTTTPATDSAAAAATDESTKQDDDTSDDASSVSKGRHNFTVAQYNTLADCYTDPVTNQLTYITDVAGILKFAQRRKLLAKTIESFKADILCLEEVDHYSEWWEDTLEAMGYESHFAGRGKGKDDGCVLAWKPEKFKFAAPYITHFTDDTKHIALLAILTPIGFTPTPAAAAAADANASGSGGSGGSGGTKSGGGKSGGAAVPPLLIAVTHFDWASPVTRLAQARQLRSAIVTLRAKQPLFHGKHMIPVIVTGDFNAEPKSPVYTFMAAGDVKAAASANSNSNSAATDNKKHNHKKNSKNQKSEPAAPPPPVLPVAADGLTLVSAFRDTHSKTNACGEPAMTIVKPSYSATVDYIFYTHASTTGVTAGIEREKVVPVPSNVAKLPNAQHPSDHLPLIATFKYV